MTSMRQTLRSYSNILQFHNFGNKNEYPTKVVWGFWFYLGKPR